MNNENKEIFNNEIEMNTSEEELVLMPPTELFDEAMEIAQTTDSDEKFPFTIHYDANQKEFLISILEMAGIIVENDDDDGHVLTTMMNMTQLAFIKRLNCVEKVKTDAVRNSPADEEFEKLNPSEITSVETVTPQPAKATQTNQIIAIGTDESETATNELAMANYGIAVACDDESSSSCCCPSNTTMESATELSIETYVRGCICCPGAEQWFKFTVPMTKVYTIYTKGSLDTVGTLYDCCGNCITTEDDINGDLNFRMVQILSADSTYYLRVRLADNDTGNYTIKLTNTIFANSVNINKSSITLAKGVRYELPTKPNYTYKGYLGARPIPELSVSVVPANATSKDVWWWEQNGNVLECSSDWDDDGDRYIHVTAKEYGTAKLYAKDRKEHGKCDACTVYVTEGWLECQEPTIYPRDSWGARSVVNSRLKHRTRKPEMIIVHHTADNYQSINTSEIIEEIKETQDEHIDDENKCDIAYHFIIDPAGGILQGAEIDDYQRGHAEGHFDDIGVVLLGDFESRWQNWWNPDTLNDNQKVAMESLAKWLCYKYDLPFDDINRIPPISTHKAASGGTECPGENVEPWIENHLKSYIANWHP